VVVCVIGAVVCQVSGRRGASGVLDALLPMSNRVKVEERASHVTDQRQHWLRRSRSPQGSVLSRFNDLQGSCVDC
jgi:hypothetical protein